ncbi:MAG: tetratricopeptide repeat protein [Kiritimatiellia bacterium]
MMIPFLSGKKNLLALLLAAALPAMADVNDELAMRGEEYMNKGRYDQAIAVFEKMVTTAQTYVNIQSIKFDLAWCYYQKGLYAKAIPYLVELAGDRAPSKDMKEQAAFLLAECHARLGATQVGKEQEKERKKNLAKAIELQTAFLSAYPKSFNLPYALYGRAFAHYLDNNFTEAQKDLNAVLANFGNTPIGINAQFLLASVYSQQGLELIKGDKKTEAQAYLDKARKIFDQLAKTDINLALANDSNYSLAETWFEAGQYPDAIRYFRSVRPKNDVLKDLKARQDAIMTRLAAEISKGADTKLVKSELGRIQGQLAGVQDSPDLMVTAYFRIADAYFRMKRYEEAMVICRHLLKFTKGDQFEQASFLLISGTIAQKDADGAAQAYEDFKTRAGADKPVAERTALSIGQLYFMQNNVVTALQYFAESVDSFPNGAGIEDALYMKAACEFNLNQADNLHETIEMYVDKFPKGHFLPNLLYFKAMNLAGANQWDEALGAIEELLVKFPKGTESFETVDEAVYQKGVFLTQLKRSKEAIALYEVFIKTYKDSRLRPFALYQMSVAFNDSGQTGKAVAMLDQLARDYPKLEIAAQAMFRIGVMYFEQNDFARMIDSLERFTVEFPESPLVVDAYFFLGWVSKEKLNDYGPAIEYLWQSFELAPNHDRAPEILFLIAQSYSEKAQRMGQPTVLPEAQRAVYRQSLIESANACEMLLQHYPNSEQALSAIPGIADAIFNIVRYKLMVPEDADKYFASLIARHKNDPGLQAQLIFSQGMFLMKNAEKEKALAKFKESLATDTSARLSSQMLLDYADASKEAGALQEAAEIYQRVLDNYSSDPNAAAPATYGLADISFIGGKNAEAEEAFKMVLKTYPWYEKGKQGKVKIAQIQERKGDYESAERMYTEVVAQERSPEARIGATLGVIRCQLVLSEKLEKQGQKAQALEKFTAADGSATKIIVMFDAYPEFVSEALYHKGRVYEMQRNYNLARQQYEKLVREYKQYPWSKKAEERLKVIPAATAPVAAGK